MTIVTIQTKIMLTNVRMFVYLLLYTCYMPVGSVQFIIIIYSIIFITDHFISTVPIPLMYHERSLPVLVFC